MSDPFAHHPSEDLEASTSITTVGPDAMNHAAGEAARLVEAAAPAKAARGVRKAKASKAADNGLLANAASDVEGSPVSSAVAEVEATPVEALGDLDAPPQTPQDAVEAMTEASEHAVEAASHAIEQTTEAATDMTAAAVDHTAEAMQDVVESTAEAGTTLAMETVEAADAHAEEAIVSTQALIEDVADRIGVETTAERVTPDSTDAMTDFRTKFAETIHSNIELSVSFWTSLLRVKSPSDVIELNAVHLRQQMESFVAQSLELSVLARKAAATSMASLTGSFGRFRG